MYHFTMEAGGLLHVATSGFWSIEDADGYIDQLRAHVAALRRERGHALVLVDGRESTVQATPVMERVAGIQSILIRDPRDRAAYVVRSSLAKMQAQRLSATDQLQVFLSSDAARSWLLA